MKIDSNFTFLLQATHQDVSTQEEGGRWLPVSWIEFVTCLLCRLFSIFKTSFPKESEISFVAHKSDYFSPFFSYFFYAITFSGKKPANGVIRRAPQFYIQFTPIGVKARFWNMNSSIWAIWTDQGSKEKQTNLRISQLFLRVISSSSILSHFCTHPCIVHPKKVRKI